MIVAITLVYLKTPSLILVFKTTYSIWINIELYIAIKTLFFKAKQDP